MTASSPVAAPASQKGILGWIERTGNRLPDPVFLFLWLILGLVAVSVVASLVGWSVPPPSE
ncbi:MAG: AbgT family transporter, partial [Alteraurantiacibacter sp.]|nr:AbgT family transporter [Alteraurantiacibacter sp.]